MAKENEEASANPLSPEEVAEKQARQQQAVYIPLLADECRAVAHRYIGIYGANPETAIWGMYAAIITTVEACRPANQKSVMQSMLTTMQKKLDAYSGKPPVRTAPPPPEPDSPKEPEPEAVMSEEEPAT